MKQSSCLRLLPYLFAVLLLFCACHDDAMPEQPASTDTEPPEALDAYHDKIREKPYPKADNELYLNPSPLIVPQTMKTGAKLQFSLSRSKNFDTPETVTSQAVAWCMFNPHKKLENGTWYWRFRNISADGTEEAWSEIHPFEVKETTPVFVTPPFETFRQYAPHTYPRLYCFLDDRIQEARQEASSHSEYQRLIQNAANALKADLTAIGNPYSQINVIKRYVQSLYQAYYLTQQETYAKRLHELLQLLLNTPVSDAVLFADNFGSTNIAYCFLKPYDLLYKRLSSEERQSVENLLMRVLRFYYPQQQGTQENRIFDNHFWQQNLRVLFQATFLLYDNEALQDEVLPIMEYYYELWTARAPASGFNRDGMWANGTGYFNNNVYTLFYMPMLLSHITRKDFLLHPWYRNAGQALTFTCPPESRNIGFGDNSEKYTTSTYQYAAFADFLARETEDGYAGWYARQAAKTLVRDNDMRLYRMASNTLSYVTELPADCPKLIWYKDAGEVAIHSDLTNPRNDLALAFRSSTFGSGSHTVSNQNAFNLLYRGANIYRSSGYYTSFSDAHNLMSYRHTRAHNTILVNGIGQPYSMQGYGNVMRAMGGDNLSYCLGDASKAYSGISTDPMWVEAFEAAGITQTPENGFGSTPLTLYRRHVLMLHPDIVVIYDELEAKEAVRWDWLLHSPTEFSIDSNRQTVTTCNTEKAFTATTSLFSNEQITLSQTDRFTVPPPGASDTTYPNQWHLTACINGKAKTRILAVIQIKPDNDTPVKIQRNGNILTCGYWTIEAGLDASSPAMLNVTHSMKKSSFHYGNASLVLGGQSYVPADRSSSILYDKINGEYLVMEQADHRPLSTRASSR